MKHIAFWTEESSPDDSIKLLKELALSHAREGGPAGQVIAALLSSDNFLAVCDFDLSYTDLSAYQAYNCRQALAFFSKSRFLTLEGVDRRQVAKDKFVEAEFDCKVTNDLFKKRASGSFYFEPDVEALLFKAQQKIARVLGEVPDLSDIKLRFGPGATTLTKKRNASIVEKLSAGISCSEDVFPWSAEILEELPHLADLLGDFPYCRLEDRAECIRVPVTLTDGIVDFVPKNAKTHRTIIKEGSLNTLVQAALGDYMAGRLETFGLGISDQSVNQKLALEGSLSGCYATLDLSSASDTISTELVYSLLPIDWALLLDKSRSSTVLLDGERIKLEKFSSMGNGFTFPLETLLFWAISSSACDDGFASVYGDDIIVKTPDVDAVMRLLKICGFTINLKKSYWTGPFRESCGADYIRGIDVRPYYQKDLVSPATIFRLHNYYVRRGDADRAMMLRCHLNPSFLIYGPDGFGDGHLLFIEGDILPKKRHKKSLSHGYGGYLFDTFTMVPRKDRRALRPGDRVLPLYTIYTRAACDRVLSKLDPILIASKALVSKLKRHSVKNSFAAVEISPEPIPERVSPVDGVSLKCPSYPGVDGYRRITIYTLDRF